MIVVDDNDLFVTAVTALFASDELLEVVGTAANGEEAFEQANRQPDIVTMDIEMPVMDGVEATRRILAALPHIRIILVSASVYADRAGTARQAGAPAYASKSRAAEDLVSTVHAIASGKSFVAVV